MVRRAITNYKSQFSTSSSYLIKTTVELAQQSLMVFVQESVRHKHTLNLCTKKCRFMEKRVREISRFFVAPRREFAPGVCASTRTSLSKNTSPWGHFEATIFRTLVMWSIDHTWTVTNRVRTACNVTISPLHPKWNTDFIQPLFDHCRSFSYCMLFC